jgi:hypothetical protein
LNRMRGPAIVGHGTWMPLRFRQVKGKTAPVQGAVSG